MREEAMEAIKNVIEFAEVLKEQHPEYKMADTLAEHIIDIARDYDPEAIYKELMKGREAARMLFSEGGNPYEE